MAISKEKRDSWLRLCSFEQVSVGPIYSYYELASYPVIKEQDDDVLHVVTDADRPDRLSFKYYGSPRLWWVIAVVNGWDEPLTSLKSGEEITIPSPRWVRENLV